MALELSKIIERPSVKACRLEFLQPDGRWTGPYCAEYMTPRAFTLRNHMIPEHLDCPPAYALIERLHPTKQAQPNNQAA